MYSVELYRRLQRSEHPVGWTESGGIKLASTPERLRGDPPADQLGHAPTTCRCTRSRPAEAAERFPLIDTRRRGRRRVPRLRRLPRPVAAVLRAGRRRPRGRRADLTRTPASLGIDVERRPGAPASAPTAGDIACEVVVNCGGMFAAEIGRLAGVRIPIVPMSHQYVSPSRSSPRRDPPLPTLRDPDLLVYFRQEVDGLVMGGYERNPAPWTRRPTRVRRDPGRLQRPAAARGLAAVRGDRRQRAAAGAGRWPTSGVRRMINGPEAFTPDNEFCLGETEVAGLLRRGRLLRARHRRRRRHRQGDGRVDRRRRAGVRRLAHGHQPVRPRSTARRATPWPARSRTTRRYYDIPYPGLQREVRPAAAHGRRPTPGIASTTRSSARRPAGSGSTTTRRNAAAATRRCGPTGWAGRYWSPAIGAEHRRHPRRRPGCSTSRRSPRSRSAARTPPSFLEWVCDNEVARGVGAVTYTQALNARGGIEADFTVTRTGRRRVPRSSPAPRSARTTSPGCASRPAPRRRRAHRRRHRAATAASRCGGRARATSSRALTAGRPRRRGVPVHDRRRRSTVGDVPVRALRVTFVGELGWELYALDASTARTLWATLWRRGPSRRPGRRRLPRDREHAAGEGLPRLGHRPHRRDDSVRGRSRLLREARQARRVRGPRRAASPPRRPGSTPPAARDRARRPAPRSCSAASRCGSAAASSAGSPRAASATRVGAVDRLRLPAGRRRRPGHARSTIDLFGDWVGVATSRRPEPRASIPTDAPADAPLAATSRPRRRASA